jgi:hypothetical protein
MSDTFTYKGAMTLEDFREIVRELQSQKPKSIDPFEYLKYSQQLQTQIDEAFRERFGQE